MTDTTTPAAAPRPRITIVLPTYNRPHTTRLALRSAIDQTYPAHEILVSDDSPGDEVRALVEAEGSPRVTYFANRPALGIPDKLNDMIARATGDWMVILGDDDQFDPKLLEVVADVIRSDPGLAMVHTRCRMVDPDGRFIADDAVQDARLQPAPFLMEMFQYWYRMRVTITGFFFPLDLIRRLGGFQVPCPDGYYYVDTMAWTNLALHGPTRLIGQPLVTLTEIPSKLMPKRSPDIRAVVAGRSRVAGIMDGYFQAAIARAGSAAEKAELARARDHALLSVAKESRMVSRRLISAAVRDADDARARAEIDALCAAVRSQKQPFLQHPALSAYLLALRLLARFPRAIRNMGVFGLKGMVEVAGRIERRGRPLGVVR